MELGGAAGRRSTEITSNRIASQPPGFSASHCRLSFRSRWAFTLPTASAGVPKASDDRVFTSQKTSVRPYEAMMSISPRAHRQLRSRSW
jgi:hypothetical protein